MQAALSLGNQPLAMESTCNQLAIHQLLGRGGVRVRVR